MNEAIMRTKFNSNWPKRSMYVDIQIYLLITVGVPRPPSPSPTFGHRIHAHFRAYSGRSTLVRRIQEFKKKRQNVHILLKFRFQDVTLRVFRIQTKF